MEHVERGAAQVAAVERRDQRVLDQVAAARHVNERRAPGHAREGLGVQDTRGRGGQGQQADQDVALGQYSVQPGFAVVAGHARHAPGPTAPAADRKAKRQQPGGGGPAQGAEPEQADPAPRREHLRQRLPDPLALLPGVLAHRPVMVQHGQHHELAHAGAQGRIEHARHRQMARQLGVGLQVVDARADRENRL